MKGITKIDKVDELKEKEGITNQIMNEMTSSSKFKHLEDRIKNPNLKI